MAFITINSAEVKFAQVKGLDKSSFLYILLGFSPHISQIFSKSMLFLQSQQIWLRQSWLYLHFIWSICNKGFHMNRSVCNLYNNRSEISVCLRVICQVVRNLEFLVQ